MMNEEGLSAERIGSEWRVARVPHVCACGKTIKKGERYEREFGIIEGEKVVVKVGYHTHSFEEEEARASLEN